MYKREFENLFNNNNLPKTMLFYGECNYQNNYYADKIIQIWSQVDDEKMLLHYDEYNYTVAKNHLSQSSLFGGQNIVIVKTDKVIPKKELDVLVEICEKSDNSYFLYQYFGESNKAKNLAKSFKKNFVRFFKPNLSEALTLLHVKAKEVNLNINGYTLQHLYLLHLEDLSLCVNEFEKLSLLNREIQAVDIDRLVYGLGSVGLDQFVEKLLKKEDIKESFSTLNQSGGGDEIRIINSTQNYLSQLLLFHMYIKIHGTFDARAILGYPLPPQIAKQRADQSIRIDLNNYKNILEHLAKTELKLKKMKNIDKNSLLLSSLIKLQSYL
ncbi:DNA polymerase III subunit delta [Sulfurospirillum arcachonense]|uniref:DNA polymerase III subunit delta n=1 Tax=Sulfurospirillum arcachonense TaxID=57666 RepID=UPI000468F49A|nr:DNA polymerase III subunit delta [Sulfurospirillum arcachonense]